MVEAAFPNVIWVKDIPITKNDISQIYKHSLILVGNKIKSLIWYECVGQLMRQNMESML